LDDRVWAGIQSLIDDYAQVEENDDVVIAYTPDSIESAAAVSLALNERGFLPALVRMFPLYDRGFYNRLSAVVPPCRARSGKLICLLFELHTVSHNKAIKTALSRYHPEQYQVIRAINSGRDLFTTGLATAPAELSALNTAILEKCAVSSHLSIEAEGGTKLEVELDNSCFSWLSNRGVRRPGQFLIIPAGEVATYPAKIDGTLVADFAINVNIDYEGDVRLGHTPVTAEIRDGSLTSFRCANLEISTFLKKCFRIPHALRVGELGFGTNRAVKNAVSENSHLNERVPGVHVGFGAHNQTSDVTGYSCDIHVDLCARGGVVAVDDAEQQIDLASLAPSLAAHPTLDRSEDVFSDDAEDDCCGILS
jgi:hypothetical protein